MTPPSYYVYVHVCMYFCLSALHNPKKCIFFQIRTVRRVGLPRWCWLEHRELIYNSSAEASAPRSQTHPGPWAPCERCVPCEGVAVLALLLFKSNCGPPLLRIRFFLPLSLECKNLFLFFELHLPEKKEKKNHLRSGVCESFHHPRKLSQLHSHAKHHLSLLLKIPTSLAAHPGGPENRNPTGPQAPPSSFNDTAAERHLC